MSRSTTAPASSSSRPCRPTTTTSVPTAIRGNWGGLHLVQTHRFAGDTGHGALSSLPWLKQDLAANAADGRLVVLFQHYGWDTFSTEVWDKAQHRFDDS